MKNPYKVVGVDKRAPAAEIKRRYKRKARELHPDRGGSTEAMAELNVAYQLLSDESARAHYDRTGEGKPPPPSIDAMAMQVLAQLFQAWIQVDTGAPLVATLKASAEQGLGKAQDERRQFEKILKRLERAAKTKSRDRGRGDAIAELVAASRASLLDAKEKVDLKVKVFERAAEMMANYESEDSPRSQAFGGVFITMAGFGQ